MSVKQDRTGVRTPAQLEQKYNFGKTFSDMLGLINDNRKEVDAAASGLKNEIAQTSTELSRTSEAIDAQATRVTELANNVAALRLDADAFSVAIKEVSENGVDRVVTESGYRFDANGLTIAKSGDQMSNELNNTGMYVKNYGGDVLTANDKGVTAVNLQAKEYLIIGEGEGRSRFEDYSTGTDLFRTGCFWVGG